MSAATSAVQRLHFGLGAAVKLDHAEIHWPSGAREKVTIPAVDRFFTVKEGKGIAPGTGTGSQLIISDEPAISRTNGR